MGSCALESTILKSWREHPPSSSSSVVKLSQLTTTINNKYESPHFLSGGYNWRLVIYPKGNEEDNGSGFISMYVECLSSTPPPMEVFAYLMFFVFNKKENKYFSIQDVEVKRFNSLRTVWGLSQVLSLETFNDLENGYILDGDECEFGADVMIASSPVSFDEKLPLHKFSWRVRDFSLLKENDYVSKSFSMGEKNWSLKMYPRGDSRADEDLSMSLYLADSEILAGDMIFVRAQLRIVDPHGSNHLTAKLKCWIMDSRHGRGRVQSASLAKIREAYLDLEDTLNVEIECEVLNAIKRSA